MGNKYTVASDLATMKETLADMQTPPTTFPYFGQKTVTTAGTRVALAASATALTEGWVYITPLPDNTGVIYVGNATVTSSNGVALTVGMVWPVRVNDLNKVNIDASVSGEGVSYTAW